MIDYQLRLRMRMRKQSTSCKAWHACNRLNCTVMATKLDPPVVQLILDSSSDRCEHALVGGKARNLWLLGRQVQCRVPRWFCVTTQAFTRFVEVCRQIYLPTYLKIIFLLEIMDMRLFCLKMLPAPGSAECRCMGQSEIYLTLSGI